MEFSAKVTEQLGRWSFRGSLRGKDADSCGAYIENFAVNRIQTNCIVNFAENAIDGLAHMIGDSCETPTSLPGG